IKILDWSQFTLSKENNRLKLTCKAEKSVQLKPNSIYLKKHILDKQIVDIDGKKVVRVNDIRLSAISSGLFVVAVDVGMEGLLRRLGLAKLLKNLLKLFNKSISTQYILWSNMESFTAPLENLKLSIPSSKLNRLHPSELADIIEDLDVKTSMVIFNSFDNERAADIMEELETDAQSNILNRMSVAKAADVLEKMPADEVADILDDLKDERAEELLQEMDQEASDEVRELMEYPENTVGSLMSTDYLSFNKNLTVEQTIVELRRTKPEPDTIYYLYVVDDEDKLIAVISLRDLIVAAPETRLQQIMNRNVIFVYDEDPINSLIQIISKYSLLAIPVVDKEQIMAGIVVINDVVYELLKSKKRRI
ncbi:MAG TPA: magnesium transporter MgtE, partial [Firmicutes bacterium]|nr:magnesium transporter MgtE [Bacillota bacterium]